MDRANGFSPFFSPATSVFSFLQPAYTYSRQDGVANIPVSREIIEDGRTQVSYRTRDLTAKDKKVSCTALNFVRYLYLLRHFGLFLKIFMDFGICVYII